MRASVHVAHPAVRRNAHPPLGRGALPRRGDGHGRIRDVQATNAKVTASTVGYSVGALSISRYELPWEETPSGRGLLTIEIDASNGASDQVRRAGAVPAAGGDPREELRGTDGDGGRQRGADADAAEDLRGERGGRQRDHRVDVM